MVPLANFGYIYVQCIIVSYESVALEIFEGLKSLMSLAYPKCSSTKFKYTRIQIYLSKEQK